MVYLNHSNGKAREKRKLKMKGNKKMSNEELKCYRDILLAKGEQMKEKNLSSAVLEYYKGLVLIENSIKKQVSVYLNILQTFYNNELITKEVYNTLSQDFKNMKTNFSLD